MSATRGGSNKVKVAEPALLGSPSADVDVGRLCDAAPSTTAGLLADALVAGERRPPKLLIVDDHPINVQALFECFAADHQVYMATSGEQALRVCAEQLPDLVLLDIELPGMDGYEVCARLKADALTQDIPVIFVTSHRDELAETRGLDGGAVDFISKPFHPDIVRARVRTHVALKAQGDLLRRWAYIDGLTGVHNRRSFDERLAVEWGRAARNRTALSVVLIDVDHFKRFNDRYGHQAGDACLRRVAAVLKAGLKRPGDLLARYGGEEFACLLPETDLAGAMQVARALGQLVWAQAIAHADSSVAPVLTVSLGVCSKAVQTSAGAAELIRVADLQLYAAKAAGRHQVCGVAMASS
jgi:diguanylate cyclase (GGDEF)-like protein